LGSLGEFLGSLGEFLGSLGEQIFQMAIGMNKISNFCFSELAESIVFISYSVDLVYQLCNQGVVILIRRGHTTILLSPHLVDRGLSSCSDDRSDRLCLSAFASSLPA
jgi:hypothetical protein